jgi:hypothetical protein
MAAAAHTPGGYGGVSQKVGKEFNQADKGTGIIKKKRSVTLPPHVPAKKSLMSKAVAGSE